MNNNNSFYFQARCRVENGATMLNLIDMHNVRINKNVSGPHSFLNATTGTGRGQARNSAFASLEVARLYALDCFNLPKTMQIRILSIKNTVFIPTGKKEVFAVVEMYHG